MIFRLVLFAASFSVIAENVVVTVDGDREVDTRLRRPAAPHTAMRMFLFTPLDGAGSKRLKLDCTA